MLRVTIEHNGATVARGEIVDTDRRRGTLYVRLDGDQHGERYRLDRIIRRGRAFYVAKAARLRGAGKLLVLPEVEPVAGG